MKIPPQFVQELKSSLNIIDVAQGFMRLVKKGRNYFALCPFHQEKTPSFSLNEQLQTFKCFGCGKGGDVITLVMELDGLNYAEAVQSLAEQVNLKLPSSGFPSGPQEADKKFLYTVMEEAVRYYCQCLKQPDGEVARQYLEKRQISPDTQSLFRLGFAPPGGFHLVNHLQSLGIRDNVIQQAGLAKTSEKSGRLYDQFRSRLMIPIADLRGRIIAFGGRILGEGEPKYLNSQETPIYHKSHHLFGLNHSLRQIRNLDQAVLVEGYFDMIVPFQAGIGHVVASLGTSLTQLQVKLLGRYSRNAVICFDPDAAGSSAAGRSVEIFLEHDFECRVATLPAGTDPDTYVLQSGAPAFQKVLEDALPFVDFIWQRSIGQSPGELTIKKRVKILENMFPFLQRIPSELERSRYLSRLAGQTGLDEKILFRQFNNYLKTRRVDGQEIGRSQQTSLLLAEIQLVSFLLHFPELAVKILPASGVTFSGLATSNILTGIREILGEAGNFNIQELEKRINDEDRLVLHQILTKNSGIVNEQEALNCMAVLHQERLRRHRRELDEQMAKAEKAGDDEEARRLLGERRKIRDEMNKTS